MHKQLDEAAEEQREVLAVVSSGVGAEGLQHGDGSPALSGAVCRGRIDCAQQVLHDGSNPNVICDGQDHLLAVLQLLGKGH